MLWQKLYQWLTAAEAITVGRESGFSLNSRGQRALNYLRARKRRA